LVEPAAGVLWDILIGLARAAEDTRAVFVILRFVGSLGLTVVFEGCLLNLPLWLIVFSALVAAVAHVYSYERLRDAFYELMMRAVTERINSTAELRALLFNILYRRHSVLREAIASDPGLAELYNRISYWSLPTMVSFQAILVALIHITSRLLGIPLHSLGSEAGMLLIVLACTAASLAPPYAEVEHGSSGPSRTRIHTPGSGDAKRAAEEAFTFGRTTIYRFFFYNIPPTLMRISQAIGVLLHMPPIRIVQQPGIIGPVLLLCSNGMKKIVEDRREEGLIEVEGNIEGFFKCNEIKGLEEWVAIQEVDLGAALDKLLGGTGEKLVIRVMDKPRDRRVVAIAIMKAWCGRRILANNKHENNRVISFYAAGVKEYVEELYLSILLATRPASEENLRIPGKKCRGPAKDP